MFSVGVKSRVTGSAWNSTSLASGAVQLYQTDAAPGPGSNGSWFAFTLVPGTAPEAPSSTCASARSSFGGALAQLSVNAPGGAPSTATKYSPPGNGVNVTCSSLARVSVSTDLPV